MNAPNLRQLLGRVRRLQLVSELSRYMSWALTVLLAACVAAIALDAATGLPAWALMAVDLPLLAVALSAVVYIGRGCLRSRYSQRHLARLIEVRLDIGDSRLINALNFAEGEAGGSGELMEESMRAGDALAQSIDPRQVIERQGLRRARRAAGTALALAAGACLLAPSMLGTVALRYLDPWGDHPPFTLQQFDVHVEPQRVLYGQPATIRATVSGPHVSGQASIMLIEGRNRRRIPMARFDPLGLLSSSARPLTTFSLPIEHAEKPFEFYIDTPTGRSRRLKFDVAPVPTFERVMVHYTYPAYTHWPDAQNPLTEQGISALQGTQVTLSIKSNLPLRCGQVVLTPDSVDADTPIQPGASTRNALGANETRPFLLKPSDTDATTVQGRFPLDFSGRYSLTLTAADGTPSLESLAGTLTATADQQPQVEIVSPQPVIAAVENWKVPVTVSARDDVGVSGIELEHRAGTGDPKTIDLQPDKAGSGLASATYEFDLQALGAKAGDVIKYSAKARDGFPASAASGHVASSPTHTIRVISMAEYLKLAGGQYPSDNLTVPANSLSGAGSTLTNAKGRVPVLGPHQPGGRPVDGGAANQAANGQQPGTAPIGSQGVNVEALDPATAGGRSGLGVSLPGVPAQYMDQAEAYFKRLADDNKQ